MMIFIYYVLIIGSTLLKYTRREKKYWSHNLLEEQDPLNNYKSIFPYIFRRTSMI